MRGLLRAVAATLAGPSPLAILAAGGGAAAGATPVRDPVIVVNGLFGAGFAYEPLVARLRADSYQVWDFELPTLGTQDIHRSAQALDGFADGVRAQTGAAKVDLVGHSEGGLVSRTYVKYYGGDDSIGNVAYTNIATVFDELVQPYTNSFLNAADGNITNKSLQSQCWLRFVGHLGLILDGAVYSGVQDALEKRPISFSCFAL